MATKVQTILSIAGSDPSGGAGIQADLKTFTVLGIYGGAATTCITVQNSVEVKEVMPLPAEIVYRQIRAVLEDLSVSHIKIGMVGNAEIAHAVSDALADFSGEVIYDPVLESSTGPALTRDYDLPKIVSSLGAQVTVLTPNLRELQHFSGSNCQTTGECILSGWHLFKLFPALKALIIKGGHLATDQAEVSDFLLLASHVNDRHVINSTHRRIDSHNTHGTGCTFAAAFAAFHQQTGCYQNAFKKSVDFVGRLLEVSSTYDTGHGTGGMMHHLLT